VIARLHIIALSTNKKSMHVVLGPGELSHSLLEDIEVAMKSFAPEIPMKGANPLYLKRIAADHGKRRCACLSRY
jgi:hypothetical protein